MRKQNVLWKKRIAFLLSAALIFGEIEFDEEVYEEYGTNLLIILARDE